MKNFNLISPSDNGFEYTIRFQDPIKIMKNSKIDFKFAELVRAGEVVFNEDQTITITANATDCLPQYDIDDAVAASPNQKPFLSKDLTAYSNTLELVFPAGVYSYTDFRTTLESIINAGLTRSGGAGKKTKLKNFQGFAVQSDLDSGKATDIAFGIDYNLSRDDPNLDPNEIELDPGGEYQMNVQVDNNVHYRGRSISKTTGGTNDVLDAGAIINIDLAYVHRYFKNSNAPPVNNFENCIYLEGIDTTSDQVGNLHFGFYNTAISKHLGTGTNRLFAGGSAGTNPIKVDGTAGTNAEDSYLPIPLGIRIEPYGGNIEIYSGFNSTSAVGIDRAPNMNYEVNAITYLERVSVHDYFDEDQTPKFFVQLYQQTDEQALARGTVNVDKRNSYIRVFALNNSPVGTATDSFNMTEIYDSAVHGEFLTHNFEVASSGVDYGIAPNAKEKAQSQLPYQVVVGMTQRGEGFKKIAYPQVAINDNDDSDQPEAGCLLLNYEMEFSKELAKALNIPFQNKRRILDHSPNFTLDPTLISNPASLHNNANLFHNSNITNPWKRDSYSIFIDLPCNNYKNTSDKINGGFRKSVIANIPSPFSSADIVEAGNTNNEMVAVYEPYQEVQSDLKNNEISINSFKISILDMKTEQLAKQLAASTVNFTIHCPSEEE